MSVATWHEAVVREGIIMKCNKKLSYRWQPPDACARHNALSRAALWWMNATYWPDFRLLSTPAPFDLLKPSGLVFGMGKLEWLGYNFLKVVWWSTQSLGTIHQHDRHTAINMTDRQTRRHNKCRANALRRAAKFTIIKTYGNLQRLVQMGHRGMSSAACVSDPPKSGSGNE